MGLEVGLAREGLLAAVDRAAVHAHGRGRHGWDGGFDGRGRGGRPTGRRLVHGDCGGGGTRRGRATADDNVDKEEEGRMATRIDKDEMLASGCVKMASAVGLDTSDVRYGCLQCKS